MSTLSVPLNPRLEAMIEDLIRKGFAANKAEVARKAIERLAEEEAINIVLQSEEEVRKGKIVRGNLKKIIKALP